MKLPLFPLNTVLFPGYRLDLQIFEARYLDMIGRCMKQGGGFGVVSIVEGREVGEAPEAFGKVGCEALIRDWQQLPNGLLGIRVEGGRRFRVLDTQVQPDQLLVADVAWLEELPDQTETLYRLLETRLRGKAPEGDELRRACVYLVRRGFAWDEVREAAARLSEGWELYE